MNYQAKFTSREELAGGVMLLRLEKPEGFNYLAGQWCMVTTSDIGIRDDRGLRRALSIASSPLEADLLFAVKMSDSAVKRTMMRMTPGAVMTLTQPVGTLVLPEETTTPLVFLAGGMGIAPFRSMIRYSADARTNHRITLFYSSRRPEETPFLEELQHIPDQYDRIRVVITMTRVTGDSKWRGLTGRLNERLLEEECRACEGALYYVAGPPDMAESMRETLERMAIPKGRIKTELFSGYSASRAA